MLLTSVSLYSKAMLNTRITFMKSNKLQLRGLIRMDRACLLLLFMGVFSEETWDVVINMSSSHERVTD